MDCLTESQSGGVGRCQDTNHYHLITDNWAPAWPSPSYSHKCEDSAGANILTNGSEDDVDDGS